MRNALDPFLFFIALSIVSLVAIWRGGNHRRRLWMLTISLLGLTAVCTPAFAYLALGALEWWYPARYDRPADAQAIVVLSGNLQPLDYEWNRWVLGHDSYSRIWLAKEIYACNGPCPIVVAGGKVDPNRAGPSLAGAMADFLKDCGVRGDDLILEEQSRNTYENAKMSARLLKERGISKIVLITEACHLWRAEACFQKQGIDVVPRGADYHTACFHWNLLSFLPSPTAAQHNKSAVHEFLGLIWYRVKGWI